VSASEPTQGTEVAALEAEQNAAEVLAEGALLGERRAAIARLAMITMFALVTNFGRASGQDRYQTYVGAAYGLFAIGALIGVFRTRRVTPRQATVRPIIVTMVDFAAITALAMLDVYRGGAFAPGRHVIAASIALSFSIARYPWWHVAYSTVLAVGSHLAASAYGGELFTLTTAFASAGLVVLGFMVGITNRTAGAMFQGLRRRDNLTRFLPRQVAERVIRDGPGALAPVEREVTVMFSDIRGFTSMSESSSPREMLAVLDDYFGRMSQIVKGHDGVVGKFLGDGLLAFWGVPDHLDDHALRAVRAARDMRRALHELNQQRQRAGKAPLRVGIGIHTGTVAAGMLGGALQSEYTVIGDAVNVASRIEGLTKDHDVDVLISETTFAQLPAPRRGEKLASAEIRGRKEPIVVYTIDASSATVQISPVPQDDGRF
jgi:adenylate cyclase